MFEDGRGLISSALADDADVDQQSWTVKETVVACFNGPSRLSVSGNYNNYENCRYG
jgi:hypothetical protein